MEMSGSPAKPQVRWVTGLGSSPTRPTKKIDLTCANATGEADCVRQLPQIGEANSSLIDPADPPALL